MLLLATFYRLRGLFIYAYLIKTLFESRLNHDICHIYTLIQYISRLRCLLQVQVTASCLLAASCLLPASFPPPLYPFRARALFVAGSTPPPSFRLYHINRLRLRIILPSLQTVLSRSPSLYCIALRSDPLIYYLSFPVQY